MPGAAAHLLTTVQAQTARLMDNITRLTPHAGWGIPVNGSALNATDGTVPLESDASVDSSPGQAHPQVDGEAVKGGLARDLELDKGLARKRGNSWSEYDKEDGPPFAGSMFEWGAIQKQAEEHLVPHVQALSQVR